MPYEIWASSEQPKALLETTQQINEQIYLVQKLRQQRSAYLSLSERAWIDNAIENTRNAVSSIAHLAEPVPESPAPSLRRLPGSFLLHKLRYSTKDSPQQSDQLVRLSLATQSLNTAMSILSASASSSSSGQFAKVNSGINALDSSWNELSELIHRRRFNNSSSASHEIQLAGVQGTHITSRNNLQVGQHRPPDDECSKGFPDSYAKGPRSEAYQPCAFRDEVEGGVSNFTNVHHLCQKDSDLLSRTGSHQCIDHGLTLIIETVEDWRQTTERALNNINALSVALTSSLMDPSMATTLGRTRLQKMPQNQVPPRKPVPDQASPTSNLHPPPRPALELSLRNSFDKETLPQDSKLETSTIQRVYKIKDVLAQLEASPSTPSLCSVSYSAGNASTTSVSTLPSQPYRISRGRALLERRAESFEEEDADDVCLPER